MTKQFLLSVESADETRLLTDKVCEDLQTVLGAFYKTWTAGPVPAVQVVAFDQGDIETLIFALGGLTHTAMQREDDGLKALIERVAPKLGVSILEGALTLRK